MHKRQKALHEWLTGVYGDSQFTITPLAGDASFRRYFRLCNNNDASKIVMDAPPEREVMAPFINVGRALASTGVHTPTIYALNERAGFAILEDLGDHIFLSELTTTNADALYTEALNTLHLIQTCPKTLIQLPLFGQEFILQELAIFHDWFLHAYLNLSLNDNDTKLLQHTFNWLAGQLAAQPQVFIHRDYHSRNLILTAKAPHITLGIIDFQDAMLGPITYDLVSLLKDCYIQWPREKVLQWVMQFYHQLPFSCHMTTDAFQHAFDLTGLQRHLKVLGVFCRLHLRDKKSTYLGDLPLTFQYALTCLEETEELKNFYQFMKNVVQPLFLEKMS